jgi:hypothetical protein
MAMTDEARQLPAKSVSHATRRRVRITSARGRVYDVNFDGNGDVINVIAVVRAGRLGEQARLNWGSGSGRPMSELTKAITRIAARQLIKSHQPEGA